MTDESQDRAQRVLVFSALATLGSLTAQAFRRADGASLPEPGARPQRPTSGTWTWTSPPPSTPHALPVSRTASESRTMCAQSLALARERGSRCCTGARFGVAAARGAMAAR
ncbi:MAG: hypothetical protein L0K86_24660 [Actinomycetia bacterium]|nr:hypothetical protein [Actinomycetes bacterium]